MTFAANLQAQLDRLAAAGWTREQIAAALGYTARQVQNWRTAEPPHALQVGVIATLRGLRKPPPS